MTTMRELPDALFESIGEFVGRVVKPLIKRIEELEATQFKFVGTWTEGLEAHAGHCCVHDGSTWIARETTTKRPGTAESGWVLAAKRGRDGKSAK